MNKLLFTVLIAIATVSIQADYVSEEDDSLQVQNLLFTNCKVSGKRVIFNLYTKDTGEDKFLPMTLDEYDNLLGLQTSRFNASRPTKVFVHGWQQTGTPPSNKDSSSYASLQYIVKAYAKQDVNLIMVDWGRYSTCLYAIATAKVVPDVGLYTATMIKNLIYNAGAKASDIHVIGHSLGAHIASFAAMNLNEKLGRITGLDPAGPNYDGERPVRELTKNDAQFVDIIHTNMGGAGVKTDTGHANFYPNGGKNQEGCWNFELSVCSHERSVAFFAETIISKVGYWSVPCDTFKHFEKNLCKYDEQALMGENALTSLRGKFFLKTRNSYPYAMGQL